MNAALLQSMNNDQKETGVNIQDKQEQIRLSSAIAKILPGLIVKMSECFEYNSDLNLPEDTEIGVSFFQIQGENFLFNCGAKLKFAAPLDFIEGLNEDSPNNLDFLVSDWEFSLNGQIIGQDLWNDNPYLHSGKRLGVVPKLTQEILDGITREEIKPTPELEKEITLRKKLAQHIRSAVGSAVKKLLPRREEKIHKEILEYTSQGVQKLRQSTSKKFPIIEVRRRTSQNISELAK